MIETQSRIKIMSPLLLNQIAAGEVIERPASIIKECLENSIDAGATRIEINIKQGGIGFIQITDNGCGIHPDDLGLAITSHATSKLTDSEQLQAIETLGFRGEALASMAAVAKFTLQSKQEDMSSGFEIQSTGKQTATKIKPVSHPNGTTVIVQDLFHNLPARRAFLRSERTELKHIEEVVRKIALSKSQVAISLKTDGKSILIVHAAQDIQKRISQLLGKAFIKNAKRVNGEAVGLKLTGFVGNFDDTRSQADKQFFFVNGRMVRDKLLMHAARLAYGDLLYPGRYACYVLYLTIEPDSIDVNVHPTKHEIRFRQTRLVHDFVTAQIQFALDIKPKAADTKNNIRIPSVKPQTITPSAMGKWEMVKYHEVNTSFVTEKIWLIVQLKDKTLLINASEAFRALCQQSYLDKNLANKLLLMPVTVRVPDQQLGVIEQITNYFNQLGIIIEEIGPNDFLIRQLPTLFQQVSTEQLWAKFLEHIEKYAVSNLTVEQIVSCLINAATPEDFNQISTGELLSLRQFALAQNDGATGPSGKRIKVYLSAELLESML